MKELMKRLMLVLVVLLMFTTPVTSHAATDYSTQVDKKGQSKYVSWTKSTAKKISNAAANKKVTISAGTYTSFSPNIRDAMIERPDVQVTVKWNNNGTDMKFVIPAGTDVKQVFDENGYAGFAFLQEFFGEKGKTAQAKAIKTIDTKAAAEAAKQKKLEGIDVAKVQNDLYNQAYDLYIQAGMTPEQATASAQAALPDLMAQLGLEMVGTQAATTAAAATAEATKLTPEEIAQQAFAKFVEQGMGTDEAFAATQNALPQLLKDAGY